MTDVFLNQFQIVFPRNKVLQEDLLTWIVRRHQNSEMLNTSREAIDSNLIEKLFKRYAVKASQISTRYLECDDVLSDDISKSEIYIINNENKNGVDILKRAQFFSARAYAVFKQFYKNDKNFKIPNHIIHVSCTGYISPSAAQRVVADEKWDHVDITHAYHMGCYAAMPAVRMAKSFVISESLFNPQFSTDIVHTEMCGLHMNPGLQTPEQMVIQTLFADGHIKYTASTDKKSAGQNLKIIAIHEKIVPDSQQDMSWITAAGGMEMNLSREVPDKIKAELEKFSNELYKKAEMNPTDASKAIFAIHPGGPKIIDSVQDVLRLKNEQISESKKILFEHGNMSSATLPHVWDEILKKNYPLGTKIISFAFGPGLTLFGSVFEVC